MYRKLADFLEKGEIVALATVIRVRGSVPREVGAKMIVHPEGCHAGTVGGGCGEAAVMRAALDVMATGQPTIVSVDLTGEVAMESTAICGGVMDIFVERMPSPPLTLAKLRPLLDTVVRREPVALATVVAAPPEEAHRMGNKTVIWPDREPLGSLGMGYLEPQALADARQALEMRQHRLVRYAKNGAQSLADAEVALPPRGTPSTDAQDLHFDYAKDAVWVFIEVQRRPPNLVIVGAGHIAQPLAEMGRLCDFTVTVMDDRSQFANRQRFPQAEQVIAGPMAKSLRRLPLDGDTYVVLITRGHQHDVECLLELLDRELAYLGMIGSRRRVRGVFKLLQEERSISQEKLQRVHAPIGLDIGAQTPAEIALTIMAEAVKVYRDGKVPSLSDDWRKAVSG